MIQNYNDMYVHKVWSEDIFAEIFFLVGKNRNRGIQNHGGFQFDVTIFQWKILSCQQKRENRKTKLTFSLK